MTFRLHTSLQTQGILKLFEARDHLPPYISAKIAIALAIRSSEKIESNSDSSGLELNRQTLLGDYDALFKALIEARENRHIEDAEYFPSLIKSYLDAGVKKMADEHKYSSDFFIHLVELDRGI